ncbi:substrate-binding periplasmic protein [Bdellovibrio sp. GT3]|uniref:substrate-binding periplasmic protein n=1 Tax=Bdellovibrio sp. GT3 TaxID=3136282 RepID=UPI0030F0820F
MKGLLALFVTFFFQTGFAKVLVGSDPYPPFIYTENGKTAGRMVEFLPLIMEVQPKDIVYRILPWKRVLADAEKGQLDFIGPLLETEERKKYLVFTEPIFKGNISLWVYRKNPRIKHLLSETFDGSKSSKFDHLIFGQILGYSFNDSQESPYNHNKVRKVEVLTVEQGVKMLATGRIDIFLAFDPVIEHFISELKLQKGDFASLAGVSQEVNYVMGISKKSPWAQKVGQINFRIAEVSKKKKRVK